MRQAQEGFRGGDGEEGCACWGWRAEVLVGESDDIVLFSFSFFSILICPGRRSGLSGADSLNHGILKLSVHEYHERYTSIERQCRRGHEMVLPDSFMAQALDR